MKEYPDILLVNPTTPQWTKTTVEVDESRLLPRVHMPNLPPAEGKQMIFNRWAGPLAGQCFCLDQDNYDWMLGRDEHGILVLVPLRK